MNQLDGTTRLRLALRRIGRRMRRARQQGSEFRSTRPAAPQLEPIPIQADEPEPVSEWGRLAEQRLTALEQAHDAAARRQLIWIGLTIAADILLEIVKQNNR